MSQSPSSSPPSSASTFQKELIKQPNETILWTEKVFVTSLTCAVDENERSLLRQVACDTLGNVFVCDQSGNMIRKLDSNGVLSVFCGVGGVSGYQDGEPDKAKFSEPMGLTIGRDNSLYVAEYSGNRIRRIRPNGWAETVVASGPFHGLWGISMDRHDSKLYFCDYWNQYMRVADLKNPGTSEQVAGTGTAGFKDGAFEIAQFNYPYGVACHPTKDLVFVTELFSHRIREMDLISHRVRTIAGESPGFCDGNVGSFQSVQGLCVDGKGTIFVCDQGNQLIRRIDSETGQITTLCGLPRQPKAEDGGVFQACFASPGDIALDYKGNLWVSEVGSKKMRKISKSGAYPRNQITTAAAILRLSRLFFSSKKFQLSPERRSVLVCIMSIVAGGFLNARNAQTVKEIGSDRKTLQTISKSDMRLTLTDLIYSQFQANQLLI